MTCSTKHDTHTVQRRRQIYCHSFSTNMICHSYCSFTKYKNYNSCHTKVSPTRQKITPTIFIPILFIFLDSHHNSKQQHTQRKNFLRLTAHVIYCRSIINHYLLIHNVFSSRNRNALS